MSPVVTAVTRPPATETLPRTDVPCPTAPAFGASRVILTGVDGRWPRPPDGVGYEVGAGDAEPPSADAAPQAVTHASAMARIASIGRVVFTAELSPSCLRPRGR